MARCSLFDDLELPVSADVPRPAVAVGRDPSDVARLTRRVADADQPDEVYGALVDLFIGTAPGDAAVRRAALAEHRAQLAPDRAAALEGAVAGGLGPTSAVPACPASLLSSGVTSATPIVVPATAEPTPSSPAVPGDHAPVAGPPAVDVPPPAPPVAGRPELDRPSSPGRPHRPRRTRRVGMVVAAVAVAAVAAVALRARSDAPAPTAEPAAVTTTATTATSPATTAATTATTPVPPPSPVTPSSASATPEAAALASLDALFAALERPDEAWDAGRFAPGSPVPDDVDRWRDRLVASGRAVVTADRSATAVDVRELDGPDGDRAVVVVVDRSATDVVAGDDAVEWAPAGQDRFTVEVVRAGGGWLVRSIRPG